MLAMPASRLETPPAPPPAGSELLQPIPIGHLTERLSVQLDSPRTAADALMVQILSFAKEAERTIAEQAARIEQLELLSLTDELTGMPNRRHFMREFTRRLALAERYGEQGAMALVDMDGFKAINDQHGHEVGDLALVSFAQLLARNVRATDFVARIGGDEFVILMVHGRSGEAVARMRLVQRMINATKIEVGATSFHLSASFGIATYGQGDTPADVLRRADLAMYADKSERRKAA
jgi:diguanylate cyclase (GGDEF)-like protein